MTNDDTQQAHTEAHADVDRPPQWRLTVYWDRGEQRFRTESIEFDHDFTPTTEDEVRLAVMLLLDHLFIRFQASNEVLR